MSGSASRSRSSIVSLISAGTPCKRNHAAIRFGQSSELPHAFALRVVEPALVDGRAGHLARHLPAPDVVGMEVSDHDPVDRPVQLLAEEVVEPGQREPGVDQQPSLVPLDHVAVDVAGRERQRHGQALDSRRDLFHRSILVYEHLFV